MGDRTPVLQDAEGSGLLRSGPLDPGPSVAAGRAGLGPGPAPSRRAFASLGLAALALSGCGVLPKDGPEGIQVRAGAKVTVQDTGAPLNYAIVKLSPLALKAANELTMAKNPTFTGLSADSRSTDIRIGVGDVISITVFEASSGGLFIPREAGSRAGNFVQIPSEQVDSEGNITVPYAGSIRVAGKTARQASEEIANRLANRAIEPQVVVSINERRGNEVSVLGDVSTPTRVFLDPGGIRVLSAIARAGGPKNPAYETIVTIQRGGRTTQSSLSSIIRTPSQNVALMPGDVVFVSREQKVFLALGATPSPGSIGGTNNRRFSFDNDNVSLTEAAAKAGGLDTTRADPRAVFLYRMESANVLTSLGVDTKRYGSGLIPTIYTVDFSRGDSFFLANSFYMRDKDVIFVSESPSTDLQKFTGILSGISGNAVAFSGLR